MNKKKPISFAAKDIAVIGLLMALKIILTRFLAIETQFVRIGFSFIPSVLLAIAYGPGVGATVGALADLAGFFLFPKGFPYFPGYTFSAAAGPFLYGLLLYRKKLSFRQITFACVSVTLLVNIGLNSLWLRILYDQAFWGMFPLRVAKNLISLPIEIGLLYWITGNTAVQRALRTYPIKWRN